MTFASCTRLSPSWVNPAASAAPFTVLVFSKTAGFRHGSIVPGIAAIQQLGAHLQANDLAAATADLQAYLTDHPGDAVMQYNLACLLCLAGDTETSLTAGRRGCTA